MLSSARLFSSLLLSLALFSCKDGATHTAVSNNIESPSLCSPAKAKTIAAEAYQHTAKILSFGHRQPESAGLHKSKSYIQSQLKSHGWQSRLQSFTADTPNGPVQYSNVIARYAPVAGKSPWSKSVKGVLAAHIDSKIQPNFLGADDAASCAGTILALAKHLHQSHPSTAHQLELVFFDGEEAIKERMTMKDGLYGSIHYSRLVQRAVASQISPYKKAPQFGIVLDMIGHRDLDIKIPADTPRKLVRSYNAARTKLGLEKHFNHSRGSFLDDHYPMNTIARIPTIDLIGDFSENKWWHTSDDNIDLISKHSLSMSIQMTLEILSNQL